MHKIDITNKEQSIDLLTVLRKTNEDVTVSSEELIKLIYEARDYKHVVDEISKRTEWIQELFNNGDHNKLPGFPERKDSYYVGIMSNWIKNLLNDRKVKLEDYVTIYEEE